MSKVGRNSPCPCGSGQKYKNCHWALDRLAAAASMVHDNISSFPKDAEPLTDDLINELVEKGWPRDMLLESQEEGCFYSASSNSVMSPPGAEDYSEWGWVE
jgi:hypothetical protein